MGDNPTTTTATPNECWHPQVQLQVALKLFTGSQKVLHIFTLHLPFVWLVHFLLFVPSIKTLI